MFQENEQFKFNTRRTARFGPAQPLVQCPPTSPQSRHFYNGTAPIDVRGNLGPGVT